MRHITISEPGGADALSLAEGSKPQPGPGKVLIKVKAAGINRADVAQRMGMYPPPPGASDIIGLEAAGEIESCGENAAGWQPGDRVCALLSGGGYAEYAVAEAAECLPVPAGMPLEEAAGLPETMLTVWSNVMQRAALQPGEKFLVHGGSSGIGTTAIQLAKLLGCQVYTTAGSEEKCRFCEELGADRAVNYRTEDFVAVLQEQTDGAGIDVTLDMVGGDYTNRNIRLAANDGRIVNIAFMQGSKVEIDLMPVMFKRLVLTGSGLRYRPAAFKAALTAEVLKKAWPWVEQGSFEPVIHQVYPFSKAAEAHRVMEASTHIGKLILSWGD